jgi:hypothetical protein
MLAMGLIGAALGCFTPRYGSPAATEPHAIVKIRRVYEESAGSELADVVRIDGRVALRESAARQRAESPRTSSVLVHPRPAQLEIRSEFYHREMRSVSESYQVPETYTATESYSCGSGSSSRTCTRSVSRTRHRTEHRTVMRNVTVVDAACSDGFALSPQIGHIYLVDFTYRSPADCAATCVEQAEIHPDGSFRSVPCPRPTDPELRELKARR